MEMHLVHKNAEGDLVVVGVMLRSGEHNAAFAPIWDNLSAQSGEERRINDLINANNLLPEDRRTYRYSGSLTTPPCTENVQWLVLKTPVEMSEAQIAAFKQIMKNNNRPVQPLNNREVLEDNSTD